MVVMVQYWPKNKLEVAPFQQSHSWLKHENIWGGEAADELQPVNRHQYSRKRKTEAYRAKESHEELLHSNFLRLHDGMEHASL